MKRSLVMFIALVAVLAMVAAACGGGNGNSGATGTPGATEGGGGESSGTMTIGSDTANDHGSKDVSGQSSIEVELDDFYFEPTVLRGTPGQQIKLELMNEGTAEHNFTLEEQSIDQDLEAGKSGDVTVTFPDSGFLEFYCKYHRGQGMVGELTVGS